MTDIVERLRYPISDTCADEITRGLRHQAADVIERLKAEVEELRCFANNLGIDRDRFLAERDRLKAVNERLRARETALQGTPDLSPEEKRDGN